MASGIIFSGAGKTFRHKAARSVRSVLQDFHLEVEEGELVALVGPSGIGKSTLLHLAAGLLRPDTGSVTLTPAATDRNIRVGMVFQEARLLNWLSVRENIRIAVRAAGADERGIDRLLAKAGLSDHASAFPLTLSGGQRQRAALVRAFAIEPEILLLDEPFSALDETTAGRLRALLQDLLASRSVTGLLVTHNLREAAFLADRIVVLNGSPARITATVAVELPRVRDPSDAAIDRICARIRMHNGPHGLTDDDYPAAATA